MQDIINATTSDQSPKTQKQAMTMADKMIDTKKHGLTEISRYALTLAIFHYASHPEDAVVLITEYLKLPPTVVLNILMVGLPFLLSIIFARAMTFLWYFGIAPFLLLLGALLLIVITSPFFVIGIIVKRDWLYTPGQSLLNYVTWIERFADSDRKYESRKFYLPNVCFFGLFLMLFFCAYLWDNPISRKWLPSKNFELNAAANLHYYCQVTGTYNETKCMNWKKAVQ